MYNRKRKHLEIENPIKNQFCVSESDLDSLLNPHKASTRRLLISNNNQNHTTVSTSCQNNDFLLLLSPNDNQESSTTNILIIDSTTNQNSNGSHPNEKIHLPYGPSAQKMSVTFLDLFYKAVIRHFSCPVCNERLHKPQMLPACGHTFCDTCLTFWFSGNTPHSCPICRRYSSCKQTQIFVYSVETFIKTVGRLETFFHTVKFIPIGHRSLALLQCLGLSGKRNSKLLDGLSFTYPRLSSKSLSTLQKKWTFEQLLHNLRFAQLQATNKYFSNLPPCPSLGERFQKCCLDIILMICPFFPIFSKILRLIKTLFMGRRRLQFNFPTVDNLCVFLVGLALGCVIFSSFSFLLQRGFRGYLRFISHVIIVFLVNDYINPL